MLGDTEDFRMCDFESDMNFCEEQLIDNDHYTYNNNNNTNQLAITENQTEIVTVLKEIYAPTYYLGYIYEKYMENAYHFISYDVKSHRSICIQLALLFSAHPNAFLGSARTEIQIDNDSVTLSVNSWVQLDISSSHSTEFEFDFNVEYYMHTINNFPIIIIFRISKGIDNYEHKLRNFVNCLINNPAAISNENNDRRVIVEFEQIENIVDDNTNNEQYLCVEDIEDIEDVDDVDDVVDDHVDDNENNKDHNHICHEFGSKSVKRLGVQKNTQLKIMEHSYISEMFAFTSKMTNKNNIIVLAILFFGIYTTCVLVNAYTENTNNISYGRHE